MFNSRLNVNKIEHSTESMIADKQLLTSVKRFKLTLKLTTNSTFNLGGKTDVEEDFPNKLKNSEFNIPMLLIIIIPPKLMTMRQVKNTKNKASRKLRWLRRAVHLSIHH